jgi:hypothetical protein
MTIKVRESGRAKKAGKIRSESEVMDIIDVQQTSEDGKHLAIDHGGVNISEQNQVAQDQPISGRGVFVVHILENAVSVDSAFLATDGNILRLPAVFPNREYALTQVEELRQIINRNFDEIEARAASN